MANDQDIALKIRVLNPQGQYLGGTVDLDIKHRTLSDHLEYKSLPAAGEIAIPDLHRAPIGNYQVTVTPTEVFKPQSQFVNIPASGFATMTVTNDRGHVVSPEPNPEFNLPPFVVHGHVIDLTSRRGVAGVAS
ncbi:MAG: hypothetical protein ABI923_13950 [bacterium]